jgi:hypothetical protein
MLALGLPKRRSRFMGVKLGMVGRGDGLGVGLRDGLREGLGEDLGEAEGVARGEGDPPTLGSGEARGEELISDFNLVR